MNNIVIKAENLGKNYVIGHQVERGGYTALRDVLMQNAKTLWNKTKDLAKGKPIIQGDTLEEVWALKDVSFEIKRGEAVGIIGRNGAGKSTLLKILSRITEPTEGRVTIKGRVASLLEVGTGFHPELTGRENIYLNGTILGMTRAEIKRKFDEIVAFAEIEKYLDTPVKRYSSGMYVRLAFAVAAHLEPEILVVDEVLAVGDAAFQKKCLGKMEDVRKEGRTVLFVSHNMGAIEQLTRKSLLLKSGSTQCFGKTVDVVRHYLQTSGVDSKVRYEVLNTHRRVMGNQSARFIELHFLKSSPVFNLGEDIRFVACVRANENLEIIRFSMTIYSVSGAPIGSCFGPPCYQMQSGEECEFEITLPNPQLAPGSYCCGLAVGKGDNTTGYVNFDVVHDILYFDIRQEEGVDGTLASWGQGWGHIIFPELKQMVLV